MYESNIDIFFSPFELSCERLSQALVQLATNITLIRANIRQPAREFKSF